MQVSETNRQLQFPEECVQSSVDIRLFVRLLVDRLVIVGDNIYQADVLMSRCNVEPCAWNQELMQRRSRINVFLHAPWK
jgi:hypothetical protein